ncbi:MAG TPA: hypothetical protein VG759_25735 [Candidatus Angelobacter sp.]|jgi:hypothetical protein|nr:hypothetical protein [Candidatus Angelobacter sp.]
MFGFQNVPAVNEWTKVQVIVEAVASVGIILTLLYSLWSFTRSLRASYYAELDRMYFDLLKIAMDRPYLLTFSASPNDQQRPEYEIYAFMVWNFLETVFDRCHQHKQLRDTWYPIISAENILHRKWFDDRANRTRFKQAFVAFIESRYPNPR